MLNKVYDHFEHRNFYNEWIEKIEQSYKYANNNINEIYESKNIFDSEIASLYIFHYTNFYSKLKHLYLAYADERNKQNIPVEQKENNYAVIKNEVAILLERYKEFISFLLSIRDIDKYKDFSIPANVPILDKEL